MFYIGIKIFNSLPTYIKNELTPKTTLWSSGQSF